MKLKDIIIDTAATTGSKMIVIGLRPAQVYLNGVRTDEVDGWRVDCVLPMRGYDRLSVKLPQAAAVNESIVGKEVSFDGLELKASVISGRGIVSATASAVHISKQV